MEKILCAYQGSEPYAFISYSHKDKGEVFPVIRAMQENGYNVWSVSYTHLTLPTN